MTPEQLEKSREEWEMMQPPELRSDVSNLITTHLIQGGKDGHIVAKCTFVLGGSAYRMHSRFYVDSPLSKIAMFKALAAIRGELDAQEEEYTFQYTVSHEEFMR